jgi:hypothetical protein
MDTLITDQSFKSRWSDIPSTVFISEQTYHAFPLRRWRAAEGANWLPRASLPYFAGKQTGASGPLG